MVGMRSREISKCRRQMPKRAAQHYLSKRDPFSLCLAWPVPVFLSLFFPTALATNRTNLLCNFFFLRPAIYFVLFVLYFFASTLSLFPLTSNVHPET
ncbi:hypothetical protein [Phaffia rhodozyma]|uniref:Transmembrane protein n=1 Tax=Phaffia rhodozyma TaxID=264483 RepID=A0A0F7SLJ9_PHARH|nr:hypothetical protein [Phaffia rhodozyma]